MLDSVKHALLPVPSAGARATPKNLAGTGAETVQRPRLFRPALFFRADAVSVLAAWLDSAAREVRHPPASCQLAAPHHPHSMSRPEHEAPPEIFYGDDEAVKYTANTRVQKIQTEMTERAIELLALPAWKKPALLLDIGCGSGLSGEILTEHGHEWVGVDISPSMLEVALERDVEGDLFLGDMGQGCPFRAGSFDGAISISVLQWLCNADRASHSPGARLGTFFTSLYAALARGSRAVFQFYPESDEQVRFIMSFATRSGFGGGLVVDYPNSKKAKKFYLVLWVGGEMVGAAGQRATAEETQAVPQGLVSEHERGIVRNEPGRETKHLSKKAKAKAKAGQIDKEWIMRKKELYRKRGKDVRSNLHDPGRNRRHPKFRSIEWLADIVCRSPKTPSTVPASASTHSKPDSIPRCPSLDVSMYQYSCIALLPRGPRQRCPRHSDCALECTGAPYKPRGVYESAIWNAGDTGQVLISYAPPWLRERFAAGEAPRRARHGLHAPPVLLIWVQDVENGGCSLQSKLRFQLQLQRLQMLFPRGSTR